MAGDGECTSGGWRHLLAVAATDSDGHMSVSAVVPAAVEEGPSVRASDSGLRPRGG
jgi:hypothetical protein